MGCSRNSSIAGAQEDSREVILNSRGLSGGHVAQYVVQCSERIYIEHNEVLKCSLESGNCGDNIM